MSTQFVMMQTLVLSMNIEASLSVSSYKTVTTYLLGAVYDPDDGLPLSFEGERTYGDGRIEEGNTEIDTRLYPRDQAMVAGMFQGGYDG